MADGETGRAESEAAGFERYLHALGLRDRVTSWRSLSGGRSATSVRAELADGEAARTCVVHLASPHGPLHGIADPRRQFELLQALATLDLPTPRPMWFLPVEALGREGFVTDFTPGEAPDPWRADGRAFIERNGPAILDTMIAGLAAIHAVPLAALPQSARDPDLVALGFAECERRRWSGVLARSPVFSADPILAYADAWLAYHLPARTREGLVHGDYRIGNLVFDAQGRLTSILDWELAEIGDPLYDLGTLCSPALEIHGRAAGLATQAALVERYEAHSGQPVDRDALNFYRILGTFKIVCLWVNASLPWSADASDLVALRAGFSAGEARPLLARALGLPVPAGAVHRKDVPLNAVADALRRIESEVLSGETRDVVRTSAAILRSRARDAGVDHADIASGIEALARDLGDGVARSEGDASAALGHLARHIFADAQTASSEHPLHVRLRDLLGAASAVPSAWGRQ
ncbi:phosphotransferase family protein [Sphingomonas sp. AOB5]|uniref:phosphotransferase family protein n=1 Tax=Sphingomonas sp. AOB5 TaxID=3034017 RepID=UPI0023F7D3BE|nr:phosphotransferase family protein [Sphingomonas sp. AOB5]MDF7774858.1 phosphotransferase family protein [Sphingomonas sp. AOB5]